jgi:hypothetical protein
MRFFELSEYQAHRVVCYCMHGRTLEGRAAARAVRAISAGWLMHVLPIAVFTALTLPTVCFFGFLLTKVA